MSDSDAVGAVVVTYHPDQDVGSRLAAIAREASPVWVIDNSAIPAVHAQLRAACAAAGCELVLLPENRGLAAALNEGFRRASAAGLTWAMAFDQDSVPETGFRDALRRASDDAKGSRPCAVVGANWNDDAHPHVPSRHLGPHPQLPGLFQRRPAVTDIDATCVITSGSLFHLPSWRELGAFDESLFLDLVDTDYCLRARAAGHRVRVASDARLRHRRGAKRPVRLLGRTYWPAFMPPLRLQYLFRNRLLLIRRHATFAPHWVAFELAYALKIVAEIVWFENAKLAKLGACARGICAGLIGRTGKIE